MFCRLMTVLSSTPVYSGFDSYQYFNIISLLKQPSYNTLQCECSVLLDKPLGKSLNCSTQKWQQVETWCVKAPFHALSEGSFEVNQEQVANQKTVVSKRERLYDDKVSSQWLYLSQKISGITQLYGHSVVKSVSGAVMYSDMYKMRGI